MFNKDLPHANERNQILDVLTGAIKFGGTIEIDNDDENGHFAITHTWNWNDQEHTRVIQAQLNIVKVTESTKEL